MGEINTKYKRQLDGLSECPRFDGGILAGGAISSVFSASGINDFDVYFKSSDDFAKALYKADDNCAYCLSVTDRSVTYSWGDQTVQLMHFEWFANAAEVFDAFDFTCCMGALDFDLEEAGEDPFILDDDFLPALASRQLSFHSGTRFPIASAARLIKYQDRGFSTSKRDMLSLAIACAGVELKSWEDLQDQLGGMYGESITIASSEEFSIESAVAAIQSPAFVMKSTPDCAFDFGGDDFDYISADQILGKLNIPGPCDGAEQ